MLALIRESGHFHAHFATKPSLKEATEIDMKVGRRVVRELIESPDETNNNIEILGIIHKQLLSH